MLYNKVESRESRNRYDFALSATINVIFYVNEHLLVCWNRFNVFILYETALAINLTILMPSYRMVRDSLR